MGLDLFDREGQPVKFENPVPDVNSRLESDQLAELRGGIILKESGCAGLLEVSSDIGIQGIDLFEVQKGHVLPSESLYRLLKDMIIGSPANDQGFKIRRA